MHVSRRVIAAAVAATPLLLPLATVHSCGGGTLPALSDRCDRKAPKLVKWPKKGVVVTTQAAKYETSNGSCKSLMLVKVKTSTKTVWTSVGDKDCWASYEVGDKWKGC